MDPIRLISPTLEHGYERILYMKMIKNKNKKPPARLIEGLFNMTSSLQGSLKGPLCE